eukprot:294711-Rhodomonas_salina.1
MADPAKSKKDTRIRGETGGWVPLGPEDRRNHPPGLALRPEIFRAATENFAAACTRHAMLCMPVLMRCIGTCRPALLRTEWSTWSCLALAFSIRPLRGLQQCNCHRHSPS